MSSPLPLLADGPDAAGAGEESAPEHGAAAPSTQARLTPACFPPFGHRRVVSASPDLHVCYSRCRRCWAPALIPTRHMVVWRSIKLKSCVPASKSRGAYSEECVLEPKC